MKLLKQIKYDLGTQPVLGSVSIIGTALAILLVMVVMMMYVIQTEPIAPESNRDRLLYEYGISLRTDQMSGSSHLSHDAIDRLYGDLTTPEVICILSSSTSPRDIAVTGSNPIMADTRAADQNVWKIFDYTFIHGAPYTSTDVETGNKVAVITESVARKLFSNADAVGQTMRIMQEPYTVVGVVKDVSPLMGWSYAQIWYPVETRSASKLDLDGSDVSRYFGEYSVISMARSADDVDEMRREIRSRNASFANELKAIGWERDDTDFPYTQEAVHLLGGTNRAPDIKQDRMIRWILLGIILIIPAINLSSMTQSRLRRRRHEIGVRRAFGATRGSIMRDILAENLVVTLIGGFIGLVLSMLFAWLFTAFLFEPIDNWEGYSAEMTVDFTMIFRWSLFGWTLLFCFILNILSAGIPAWRASRVDPVDALNGDSK